MSHQQKTSFTRQIVITVSKNGERLLTKAFEKGPVIIGRQPGCDLILEFGFISRTHCQVIEEFGHFYLVDLGSRNGLIIGGEANGKFPILEKMSFVIDVLQVEIQLLSNTQPGAQGQDAVDTIITPLIPSPRTQTRSSSKQRQAPTSHYPEQNSRLSHSRSQVPSISSKSRTSSSVAKTKTKTKTVQSGPKQNWESPSEPAPMTPMNSAAFDHHQDMTGVHPGAEKGLSKRLEAVVLWHDQIMDVHEFEPSEKVTIGSSNMASIRIPTLPQGWKLAQVDFESSHCFIPQGPSFSILKSDGQVYGQESLLSSQIARSRGSGFVVSFSAREVLQIDLGHGLQVFMRYIPATPQLTTRKPVEPDSAIKHAFIGSSIVHLIMAAFLLISAPVPKNVPKIRNVPERFARLLVDPPAKVEPTPAPTPMAMPTPVVVVKVDPPKPEVKKPDPPPKPPKVAERVKPVNKKMELPKQMAKQNKWPIVVKKPVRDVVAAPVNNPKKGPEAKTPSKVTQGPPSAQPTKVATGSAPASPAPNPVPNPEPVVVSTPAPPPVNVETLGALAALGEVGTSNDKALAKQSIQISKNGKLAKGTAVSTSEFGQGVPSGGSRMPAGSGTGSGGVKTKGNGSGTGDGYGTQGLSGKAGSRGIAGAIVGQPQLAGTGVNDGLTRDEVMRTMQKHLADVQHCYEKNLLSNPDLHGRMEFEWDIEPDGSVSTARIKKNSVNGGDGLGECVKGVIKGIKFPKAKNGQGTSPSIGFPFGRL